MGSTLVLSDVGDETWGAVLEDGLVVELHVETSNRPGIAGNVYKGRVSRVVSGMQAAFVDIGLERDTFLHVSDLPGAAREIPELAEDDDELAESSGGAGAAPRTRAPAAVYAPIQDLLRDGQEIVVQIAKEAIAAKGARATAQIGLPGRALVYLPFLDRVFVSRRIVDTAERERLALLTTRAARGEGGWILRTAAEGATEAALARDAAYLQDLWGTIRERERRSGAPALLRRDLDLAERLCRDVLTEGFQEVVVDSERLEGIASQFLGRYMPGLDIRVRAVPDGRELFEHLGIHAEIERALLPRLFLKSGGSIVVNQTEALVAIDVNTGKYVGRTSFEETALKTNLEAVREIVRLLRLRDLGGIIVIDFIDMVDQKNREALSSALQEELRKDRARSRLLAMSDFGLVQLTRKRTRRSLERALQIPCPGCSGAGRVRSPIALYYEIERDLARGSLLAGDEAPLVRLHPLTIARLDEEGLRLIVPPLERSDARSDARAAGHTAGRATGSGKCSEPRRPRVQAEPSLRQDQYEIIW